MLSNNTSSLQPSRPAPASPTYAPFSLKKKTMSVTQTYYLAHKARSKLSREASRSDHNLRLLVGHANLLDCLMLELADAEREQETWFNQSVRGASSKHEGEETQKIEYEDTIIEVPEDDDDAWDSDSDSSDEEFESQADEEDVEMADAVSLRRIPTPNTMPHMQMHMHANRNINMDEDDYAIMDDDEDDDEDYADLGLVRTVSHTTPPELDDDSDTSEEETMPPSPPTALLTFSDKEQKELQQQQQQEEEEETFYNTGFYLPARNPARMVSAI